MSSDQGLVNRPAGVAAGRAYVCVASNGKPGFCCRVEMATVAVPHHVSAFGVDMMVAGSTEAREGLGSEGR